MPAEEQIFLISLCGSWKMLSLLANDPKLAKILLRLELDAFAKANDSFGAEVSVADRITSMSGEHQATTRIQIWDYFVDLLGCYFKC